MPQMFQDGNGELKIEDAISKWQMVNICSDQGTFDDLTLQKILNKSQVGMNVYCYTFSRYFVHSGDKNSTSSPNIQSDSAI